MQGSGAGPWASLRVPVVLVVLRGYDDDHGEDGTEHHGCDAHGQGDEGEVPGLARSDLGGHHVPARQRCAHLRLAWGSIGKGLGKAWPARLGGSPESPASRGLSLSSPTCTALNMAMMPVGQKQQMVVSTAMGM